MGNLSASQAPAFGLPEGEFVFVRHGFSCANALKRAGGIVKRPCGAGSDSALTEEGKAQARDGAAEIVRWGERRKASFVALDGKLVILTSPLRRAMQTGFELGATLAPRLGFDDFAIVPVTGLVEWPKSRMSDVGARSDDNIPYFRWGDDAEIAAKVPVRFQTAFRIAEDENRNPVLADAFEGKGSNWRGYTFREGWEGVRKRIDGNLKSVLKGDVAIVVSHHARMERYSEVEKRAKAAAKRCDTVPACRGAAKTTCARSRTARAAGRRSGISEWCTSRCPRGDPPRSGRAEGRRQGASGARRH